jgi:hypothetical protein
MHQKNGGRCFIYVYIYGVMAGCVWRGVTCNILVEEWREGNVTCNILVEEWREGNVTCNILVEEWREGNA